MQRSRDRLRLKGCYLTKVIRICPCWSLSIYVFSFLVQLIIVIIIAVFVITNPTIYWVFPGFQAQSISLFTPHSIPQVWYYYDSHFMDEEAEAQWVNVPSISQRAREASCSSQTVWLLCLQCFIVGGTWHFIHQLQNSAFANLIII